MFTRSPTTSSSSINRVLLVLLKGLLAELFFLSFISSFLETCIQKLKFHGSPPSWGYFSINCSFDLLFLSLTPFKFLFYFLISSFNLLFFVFSNLVLVIFFSYLFYKLSIVFNFIIFNQNIQFVVFLKKIGLIFLWFILLILS